MKRMIIIDYTCKGCGQLHRIVKNWIGQRPNGGFGCQCGRVIGFEEYDIKPFRWGLTK